ncbi:MAG: hypothetical protein HN833_03590 [Elusimicrobiaceae bacterium]|nr:hypothetical protein [Elusimicrobiaceae bacterium]MBT3954801.1 hypothetical protein [Elusimicrobiaceae bacterium]MBT4008795.1 hypothetical protein [Elusimicrobiaceae bacterium]MBT4402261.1 hypothetical protein [Elusimicrobiaceae bacterium]MBT4440282.1 hypothetical protein [Elusimicrobiaceae bacterium]
MNSKIIKKLLVVSMSTVIILTSSISNAFADTKEEALRNNVLTWYKKMFVVEGFEDEDFMRLLKNEIKIFISENNLDEDFYKKLNAISDSVILQNRIGEEINILKANIPSLIINSFEQEDNKKIIVRYRNIIAKFLATEQFSKAVSITLTSTVVKMIRSKDADVEKTGIIFAINLLLNPSTNKAMNEGIYANTNEYKFMRVLILHNNAINNINLEEQISLTNSMELIYKKEFLKQDNSLDFLENAPSVIMTVCCLVLVHQAIPSRMKKQAVNIFKKFDTRRKFNLYENIEFATVKTGREKSMQVALVGRNHVVKEFLARSNVAKIENIRESFYLWSLIETTGFTPKDALLLQMVTLFFNIATNYVAGVYITPHLTAIHGDRQDEIKRELNNNLQIQLNVIKEENRFLENLNFGN